MDWLRDIDLFQNNTEMINNHNERYKTKLGGWLSLIIVLLCLIYFVMLLISPIEIAIEAITSSSSTLSTSDLNLSEYVESKLTTQYENRLNNYKEYTPFQDDWNIVFAFSISLDPAYVQLVSTYIYNDGTPTSSSYSLVQWSTYHFSSETLLNLSEYTYGYNLYCIDLEKHGANNLKFIGDYTGDIKSIFYISFIKWFSQS